MLGIINKRWGNAFHATSHHYRNLFFVAVHFLWILLMFIFVSLFLYFIYLFCNYFDQPWNLEGSHRLHEKTVLYALQFHLPQIQDIYIPTIILLLQQVHYLNRHTLHKTHVNTYAYIGAQCLWCFLWNMLIIIVLVFFEYISTNITHTHTI